MDDQRLRAIDSLFWGAAYRKAAWRPAIDAVAAALGARGSWLLPLTDRRPGAPHSATLGGLVHDYFQQGWFDRDYRFEGIPILLRRGMLVDQDLGSTAMLARQPSYAFLSKHKLRWFAAIPFEASGETWAFSVHRTDQQGPFTLDEQASLRRVQAVVDRATKLSALMAEARLEGVKGSIEESGQGCILLDRGGRPFWLNRQAGRVGDHILAPANGTVRAVRRDEDARLQRHLQAALWDAIAPDAAALRPVLLQGSTGSPLVAQAFPIRGESFGYFGRAKVVLTLNGPSRPRRTDRLRGMIGLPAARISPPPGFSDLWH